MVSIRRAVPADCPSIHEAHTRAIRELCSIDYEPAQIEAWAGARQPTDYLKPVASGRLYVAVLDGNVVGFSEFHKDSQELKAVYVNPDYTRRGIGKALFEHLCNEARGDGINSLWLNASLTAVPFYLAVGCRREKVMTHRLGGDVELACVRMTIGLNKVL